MKWFKHDSNANADAKLRKVRIKYGMEGYGLYWYCLELIAQNVEKNNLTFELEHDAEIIAHDTGIHYERVQEMMTNMVNLGLFEASSGRVTCLKMLSRMDGSMVNAGMRTAIEKAKSHDKVMISHDGVMTGSCENRTEQNRTEQNIYPSPNGDGRERRKRRPPVPVSEIVDLYHRCLPELPRVEKLTKTREGFIRQRWQEDLTDLDHWRNYFDFVRQSDFLMGRSKPTNGKPPFRADIEWITRPNNYAKIAEEKYHG